MEEKKEQKILLNIEELEERIAPHDQIGGGHATAWFHGGEILWRLESSGPFTTLTEVPDAAEGGLERAHEGGGHED